MRNLLIGHGVAGGLGPQRLFWWLGLWIASVQVEELLPRVTSEM
jgi:hypothetical protein